MRTALIMALVIMLGGCGSRLVNPSVPSIPSSNIAPGLYLPPIEKEYHIAVGDRLGIVSYYDKQLNQDLIVRPDGRISLVLLDDILVVGMTPSGLDKLITDAYSQIVQSPDVTVVVRDSTNMSVYISGEVKTPSTQVIRGPKTVLQSITEAGGFLSSANMNQVLILRKQTDGKFLAYKLDIESVLLNEVPDMYLQRSDVVYVPKTAIANVGLFVEQYINAIIPRSVQLSYGWVENRTPQVRIIQ